MFLAATIAASIALIYYWDYIETFQNYGYPFVFLVGFFAAFSLPNPAPYIIIVFAMGTVLNPALVGAVSGLGAGMSVTLVYLFGRGGHKFFPKISLFSPEANGAIARWTSRVLNWAQQRGSIAIFVMSTVFVPVFFSPIAIAMGTSRFGMWKFFLLCWAGNTVKSLIIAYAGYFGLGALLR